MADKQKKQNGNGNVVWMITIVIICIALPAWTSLIFGVGVPKFRAFVDTRMEYQYPTNVSLPAFVVSSQTAGSDKNPPEYTVDTPVTLSPYVSSDSDSRTVVSPDTTPIPVTERTTTPRTSSPETAKPVTEKPVTTKTVTTKAVTTKIVTTKAVTTKSITTTSHSHSYMATSLVNPTCEKSGSVSYLCACGDSYTKTLKATGHSYEKKAVVEPTLKTYGYDLYVCSVCGKSIEKNKVDPYPDASYVDLCTMVDLRCLPNLLTPDYDTALPYYLTRKSEFDGESVTLTSFGTEYSSLVDWIGLNSPKSCSYGLSMFIGADGVRNNAVERSGYFDKLVADDRKAFAIEDRVIAELGIDCKTTQREAIERINDWMCQNLYYDYENGNTETLVMLEKGGGICCAYAEVFNQFCHACGISCESEAGYNGDSSHQWNRILFSDGTILYVDVCWNDAQYVKNGKTVDTCVENGVSAKRVKEIRSTYLLLPYEEFSPAHHDVYSETR